MHGHTGVSKGFHLADQGRRIIVDVHLIGHGAGGEQRRGIAGEEFILGVCRGTAEHGGIDVSLYGVFRQAVEKGQRVFAGLHVGQDGKVGKGLVHDDDEIDRRGLVLRQHRRVGRGLRHQRRHALFIVALRGADLTVPEAEGKVQGQAVALGGPQGGLDPGIGHGIGTEEKEQKGQRQGRARSAHLPDRLFPSLPHRQEGQHHQHHQHHRAGAELHLVQAVIIVARYIGRCLEGQQVGGENGAAPEAGDVAIGHADEPRRHQRDPGRPQRTPGDEIPNQQPHIVPGQIQRDLKRGKVGPGLVIVEKLHQRKGEEGHQRKDRPGNGITQPPGKGEFPPPDTPGGET